MPSTHREFVDLLPWYVNGTLPDAERDSLRAHLGECLPCHAAYREELRLHRLLEEQGAVPLGRDRGLSELLQRIDRVKRRGRFVRPAAGLPGLAVAAAAVLIVAGLAVFLPHGQPPAQGDAEFSTLFGEGDSADGRVDVIFAEAPAPDELAQFLDGLGAVVASGPTDLGRYTLELAADRDLDRLLDDLRSDPRVRFAGRSFAGDAPEAVEAGDAPDAAGP